MVDISSADFMRLTVQEVVDMLLDQELHTAICRGMVDDSMYNVIVKLELVSDE